MIIFFSILAALGQIILIFLIFFPAWRKKISGRAVLFSFLVALTATLGSLIFSEILKLEPCKLCWFQRIFMYPQVIIFGLALLKKNKNVAASGIFLSLIGALIAIYNYYLQIFPQSSNTCSLTGYSVSCSQTFSPIFGYITIPMMSLTAFLLIILFMISQNPLGS